MSQTYQAAFDALLSEPAYGLEQDKKQEYILPLLNMLDTHHRAHCRQYAELAENVTTPVSSVQDLPFLTVQLFKLRRLASVPESEIFRVLQSSGTTSQTPAKVILDKATSARQSKVLVNILQHSIGKSRLPMLIIDSPEIVKKGAAFSARAAGIQGLMFFGRDHTYALDENMNIDWPAVTAFCEKYQNSPVLLFGFTFMVWQYFVGQLVTKKPLCIPEGILLHSGGWKKLIDQRVSNSEFKRQLETTIGIQKVINFYGMAEQVGSVFTECEYGHLHAPNVADVIIRDPYTLKPVQHGISGLIQMLSVLPTSYPGQSILTEDIGRIIGEDDCACGRKGKYIVVEGRLPKTEIRGCSDTQGEAI